MNGETQFQVKPRWVIVADASKATIYSQATNRSPLEEMTSLENSVAREKTADLISDSGGRSFDSRGRGRHTMTREKPSPKGQSAKVFAKEIAAIVAKAGTQQDYRDFVLVAAPRFLGVLRKEFAATPNCVPVFTVDKEVVGRDTAFVEKLLADH